jgi:hypothetical protein
LIAVIPLLLAATPLPVGSAVPFQEPAAVSSPLLENFGQQAPVRTFDPVARAMDLASTMPRQWSGTYQPFASGTPVTVQLDVTAVQAMGQMVDLRGQITVGSTTLPVQGNLNASSDQLDLLVLGDVSSAGLEDGGRFLGLQGFTLSGWSAPRLTNPGGQLVLNPVGSAASPAIRGLW